MIHRVFHRVSKLGLFGTGIGHSLSPTIHQAWGRRYDIPLCYDLYDVSLDALKTTLEAFQASGGLGANVTMPFKEAVLPFISHFDPLCAQVNAVNTLVFREGRTLGSNTDCIALKHLFAQRGLSPSSSVMIFGAGGGARAALTALGALGVKAITLVTRSPEKAKKLLPSSVMIQPWPTEASFDTDVDMIINASPVGMKGNPTHHLPLRSFEKHTWFFDMVYSPHWTPFLRLGERHKQPLLFGIDMLLAQARESFSLWFGVYPDEDLQLRESVQQTA